MVCIGAKLSRKKKQKAGEENMFVFSHSAAPLADDAKTVSKCSQSADKKGSSEEKRHLCISGHKTMFLVKVN